MSTLTPYYTRVGSAWTIVFNLTNPDGSPRNLSGESISASYFDKSSRKTLSLTGANGSVVVTDALAGRVVVKVSPNCTRSAPAQSIDTTDSPLGISVTETDTAGDPHILDPQPIVPLSFSDFNLVPANQVATLVGLQQQSAGPAGPPNVLEIGSVTTLQPGVPASASLDGSSPNQTLNLAIPQGLPGGNFTLDQVQALILDSFAATQGASLDLSSSSNLSLF